MNFIAKLRNSKLNNLTVTSHFSKLVRIWPWLHAFCLFALILQPTTPAVILGRYSKNAIIIGAIALLFSPIVVVTSRWFANQIENEDFRLSQKQYILLIVMCGALLLPIGAVASLPTNSYICFAFYIAYVLCTTALWSLNSLLSQRFGEAKTFDRQAWAVCIIGCLLLFLLAAYFPGQYWTDEGYNSSLALSISRDSQFTIPIFRLTPYIYGPNYSLVYVTLGVVYKLFGVHLAYGRMLIFAVGLLSLFFISRACLLYYSASTTRIVVTIAGFVLLGVNYLRADIEVAMWLSVALWAYASAARNKEKWQYIVVGLAVGFSLDGHPNAYRFAVAFGVAFAIDFIFDWRIRRSLISAYPLFSFLIGLFVGVVIYTIFYTVLAPGPFTSRVQSFHLTLNFPQLFMQIGEQINSAIHNGALLFGFTAVGFAVSLRRKQALDRLLVIVLIVSSSVLALIYGYYRDYYFVHLLPVYILLAATTLDWFERSLPHQLSTTLMNAFMFLIVFTSIGWLSAKIIMTRSQDYSQALVVAEQIRTYVPTQDVFIGADPLYLKMVDYPHFVEFNTGLVMAQHDGISETAAWNRINPSSVAILHDYPIPPPQSLLDYLTHEHFTLVHCWDTDRIGRVELYMKTPPVDVTSKLICDKLQLKRSVLNSLW